MFLYSFMQNISYTAKVIRKYLRKRTVSSVKTYSIKSDIREGNLFSEDLFDPSSLFVADERSWSLESPAVQFHTGPH